MDAKRLLSFLEQLHSHRVYRTSYVASALRECGLDAEISADGNAVIIGLDHLQVVEPEWGEPGISPRSLAAFAFRRVTGAEPHSEMIGRGFWLRDVLSQLRVALTSNEDPQAV